MFFLETVMVNLNTKSHLSQAWRRLHVKRQYMCQTTWIIQMTLALSKAQLLASDPVTSQTTSFPVSSLSVGPAASLSVCFICS